MWLFNACIGAVSAADCPSLATAGCRGWTLLCLAPALISELSIVLPFYGAIASAVNTTENITASEGGIMDSGSMYNS